MYKKILAPLDGSKLAECALEHVKTIATGCSVPEVVLLRVVDPSYSFGIGEIAASNPKLAYEVEQETEKEHKTQAQKYVDELADRLKNSGVAATGVVIAGTISSSIAGEILNYAHKNNVDLIIMSTHGRSGVTRWAFGSIADRVSHYSTVPVLMISSPGCRSGKA